MYIHADDQPTQTTDGPARQFLIIDDTTHTILAAWWVLDNDPLHQDSSPSGPQRQEQHRRPRTIVPPRYTNEWAYFVDWACAFDHEYLPTTPAVVAEFLGFENPSEYTRRGAVTAINAVHRANGFPPPGRSIMLRGMLSRRFRDVDLARRAIANQPTTGSAMLRGRRDALLLWLTEILLVPTSVIANLRTDGIRITENTIELVDHDIAAPLDHDDPNGLYRVIARWATVVARADNTADDNYPMDTFPDCEELTPADVRETLASRSQPLIPGIDQWGNILRRGDHSARGLSAGAARIAVNRALQYGVTGPDPIAG
ncbi:hypothetical protein ACWDTI_23860 [Gordonia sp. NPDC003424]